VRDRRAVGARHEDAAADYLLSLGYTLVARRYRAGGGEVDLIALDGDVLVFVEVKYRKAGPPELAVDRTKVSRISNAADAYLAQTGSHLMRCRFDVVAVFPGGLRHHVGAFYAEGPPHGPARDG
jgi:putative endonuclease